MIYYHITTYYIAFNTGQHAFDTVKPLAAIALELSGMKDCYY